MINIFGGKTPVTKESIAAKAGGALAMFQTAISNLDESNAQAEELRLQNQIVIDELTADNNELEEIVSTNSKITDKIKKLIS